jgi:hypothetical protein
MVTAYSKLSFNDPSFLIVMNPDIKQYFCRRIDNKEHRLAAWKMIKEHGDLAATAYASWDDREKRIQALLKDGWTQLYAEPIESIEQKAAADSYIEDDSNYAPGG